MLCKVRNEIWKDIKGYEGWYQVSNQGRVRSLDRTVYFKDGKRSRTYKGKILRYKYHHGYQMVNLLRNKEINTGYVHKLVINAFIPKVKGKTWTNHKNGIKSDNRAENLEWCTPSENNIHAKKMGLRKDNVQGLIAYTDTLKKQVVALKDNKVIKISDCSRDMAEWFISIGIFKNVSISTAGRSIRRSASEGVSYKGYYFQYI